VTVPSTGYYEYGPLVVIRYLKTRLTPDVVVASEVPNPRPPRLVVVSGAESSGAENLVLSRRRNIIQCYGVTEILAGRLAETVRGYLMDARFINGAAIRSVNVIGEPFYFPNPDDPSKTPRVQLTVDVLQRAKYA
jgi:hypothetical protein